MTDQDIGQRRLSGMHGPGDGDSLPKHRLPGCRYLTGFSFILEWDIERQYR
jgi:hypothetical protein